jgi:two-component system sensor histidine kinase RpfC
MDATRTRLGDLIGGKPCCLFLTYAARRSVRHGDGVGCLPKPFLAEDLVQAAEELLGLVAPAAQQKQGTSRLAGGSTASVEALRLLVAEDNAIAAKVVTRFLRKDGYRVTQLGDGEQALEEALRGDYAMAIVDLRMPKVDGIEFTKRYRAAVPDGRLRIVALTANASEDVKNTCLEAGMDGFLSKPVNPDLLRETIERLARLDTVINRDAAGRERPISIPAGKSEVERHVHGARE